jgi:hypothetical protein
MSFNVVMSYLNWRARMLRRRAVAGVVVLAAGVVSVVMALPSTAAAAQKGLVTDLTWGDPSPGAPDRTIAAVRDSGAQWVLMSMRWADVEKTQGSYDESTLATTYDPAINLAHNDGVNVIVMVTGTPTWATWSGTPPEAGDDTRPPSPSHLGDFAAFMKVVAARYAGKVQAWEIWNEENYHRFWSQFPRGDPSAYADLLKAAYPGVKAGDPGAKVLFGGLRFNDTSFLQDAYAHMPDLGNYFDVMGVHPYVPGGHSPEDTTCDPTAFEVQCPAAEFPSYRQVRQTLLDHGDNKPLWFTELGWSTTTASDWGVSEPTQADYLTRSYRYVEQDPYVQVVFWYQLRNNYWGADANDWPNQLGLLRTDFSPKPAYAAFKAYTPPGGVPSGPPGSGSPPSEPTTTPSGPAPLVQQPTSTTVAVHSLSAFVARSTRRGPRRIVGRFTATGRVRNADGGLVRLAIQHRSRRGFWHTTISRTLRLDPAGRVATRVRTGLLGRWRIRATYLGSIDRKSSTSSWRYFNLVAPRPGHR